MLCYTILYYTILYYTKLNYTAFYKRHILAKIWVLLSSTTSVHTTDIFHFHFICSFNASVRPSPSYSHFFAPYFSLLYSSFALTYYILNCHRLFLTMLKAHRIYHDY